MKCDGCDDKGNVRRVVLNAVQHNTRIGVVTLREGMLGALLEHASVVGLFPDAESVPPECRGPNPAPWCKYARMGGVITEGRQALADVLLQQGLLSRRDAAKVLEHLSGEHFHAVLSVALGRSKKLGAAGRLALAESAAGAVGLYGPDSPWADICAGANPPRICWYIHARRHDPFVTAVAREVVAEHLLHHYKLLNDAEYALVLDTRIGAVSRSLAVSDLTVGEVRALAEDEIFSAEERYELLAGARRASVGLFDPDNMPKECMQPNPPRWCWVAGELPVFDTVLQMLEAKGVVNRAQLLKQLSRPTEADLSRMAAE